VVLLDNCSASDVREKEMRNFVDFGYRSGLARPLTFIVLVTGICVILVGRVIYYLCTPPVLVGTYVAHYGNVTQKLIIEPRGIYEQAISIGKRKLTNKGRWRLAPGMEGENDLLLEHSLMDQVAMGDSPGSFIYGSDQIGFGRDFLGRTTLSINEDLDLYFTRQ